MTVEPEALDADPELPRNVSMQHVADIAGVTKSSVSRVLSGHPDVSQTMRDRVLRAAEKLSYEPNFLAKSLRTGATHSIGFSLSSLSNPVLAEIAHGVEDVLTAAGYAMLVMSSENDPALDVRHIRFLQGRRVDGMVLSVANERRGHLVDTLARLDIPIVMIDRDVPRHIRASAVYSDHRTGMAAAGGRLLDLGHRRIALLSLSLDLRPGRERLAGLRQAYETRGLPDTVTHVPDLVSAEQSEKATNSLLDQPHPPTAIVAGANPLLIGCLRALRRRNLHPGRDLALVSWDDVPLAELFTPPIATITRDNQAMGRTAAELLLRRLRGAEEPETVMLPTTFVPRESCCPPM